MLQLTVADTARLLLAASTVGVYLFHVLVTFGIGGAAATFWWSSRTGTVPALDGIPRTQVLVSVGFTALLLAVESGLYLRAVATRWRRAPDRPELATAT